MTAQVDAVVYFRIQDPVASVLQAENAKNSTYRVAQGTLRDVLGTKSLAEILSDREEISDHMGVSWRQSEALHALCECQPLFPKESCMVMVGGPWVGGGGGVRRRRIMHGDGGGPVGWRGGEETMGRSGFRRTLFLSRPLSLSLLSCYWMKLLIVGESKWSVLKCKKCLYRGPCVECGPAHCRKDVSLPQDMQRSMAAEAEADREAKAKVSQGTG